MLEWRKSSHCSDGPPTGGCPNGTFCVEIADIGANTFWIRDSRGGDPTLTVTRAQLRQLLKRIKRAEDESL